MAGYNEFAPFYDRFQATIDYAARAAYFDTLIQKSGGGRGILLDLACGTGKLSVELSRLGYDVIGVDESEGMLSCAQQRVAESGENVLLLCQDMENLDLYGTVTSCVCALDSLNHLTDEAAFARAISRVSLFLEPGGVFVFDLNTPYKHRELLADRAYVYEDDDAMCVWRNDTEGDLTHITLDFFSRRKNGLYERTSEEFSERAYSADTVRRICAENGLSVCALYADDTYDAPTDTSRRYIFVTRKD